MRLVEQAVQRHPSQVVVYQRDETVAAEVAHRLLQKKALTTHPKEEAKMNETNEQTFDRHFSKLLSGSCDSHLSAAPCLGALRSMRSTPIYGLGEMSTQLYARASALAEASGRSYESVMIDMHRPTMSRGSASGIGMIQVTM